MDRILVVEVSRDESLALKKLLEKAGFRIDLASNGREALESIASSRPDLVLTDLEMPEVGGIELVETVRLEYPGLPVILMTAQGSEEATMEALKRGAASYIPKRLLQSEVLATLRFVLNTSRAGQDIQRILDHRVETEYVYELACESDLVGSLVNHLADELQRAGFCDEPGVMPMTMGLTEAIDNAMFHGNLELDSDLKELGDDGAAWNAEAARRREIEPYKDRRVRITMRITPSEAMFRVADQGPGFDPTKLPDPTDPANIEKASGRGLLLISTFMDEVRHNEQGNEITMIKRRDPSTN